MTKEECHEYKFELTFSQYNSEEEIPDITLERILDAMIDLAMVEELRMSGGYHEYTWIDMFTARVDIILTSWRNRILRLLGKNCWRKGIVTIVEYSKWVKYGAPKDWAL